MCLTWCEGQHQGLFDFWVILVKIVLILSLSILYHIHAFKYTTFRLNLTSSKSLNLEWSIEECVWRVERDKSSNGAMKIYTGPALGLGQLGHCLGAPYWIGPQIWGQNFLYFYLFFIYKYFWKILKHFNLHFFFTIKKAQRIK